MTKNYHHPTFVQYIKSHINLFLLYSTKKNQLEKRKKIKEEKNKIGNIIKGKKIKGKEISCRCIGRCSAKRYSWCCYRKYFI